MVLKEFLGLANLMKTQTLYIYKLTEIIMVNKNENYLFTAFKIVLPDFK